MSYVGVLVILKTHLKIKDQDRTSNMVFPISWTI